MAVEIKITFGADNVSSSDDDFFGGTDVASLVIKHRQGKKSFKTSSTDDYERAAKMLVKLSEKILASAFGDDEDEAPVKPKRKDDALKEFSGDIEKYTGDGEDEGEDEFEDEDDFDDDDDIEEQIEVVEKTEKAEVVTKKPENEMTSGPARGRKKKKRRVIKNAKEEGGSEEGEEAPRRRRRKKS